MPRSRSPRPRRSSSAFACTFAAPALVHVLPESAGEDLPPSGRQCAEQRLFHLGEIVRETLLHVEEILLILIELVPRLHQPMMVRTGVRALSEEDSGQVVLRFPFREDRAGHSSIIACSMQLPSRIAFRIVRSLAVAVTDGDQPGTIPLAPHAPLDLFRHLSRTAHAVEPDRLPRPPPKLVERFTELRHDPPHERAVAQPILDEDHQWFVGEADGILGIECIHSVRLELVPLDRTCRHPQSSPVGRQGPRTSPRRGDEHLAYPFALKPTVTNPG